jgi:hypothetical protein
MVSVLTAELYMLQLETSFLFSLTRDCVASLHWLLQSRVADGQRVPVNRVML